MLLLLLTLAVYFLCYCALQLREGRDVRSRTVSNNNNPDFNQNFRMLVDDTDSQESSVRARLMMCDMCVIS
jgi:hypothetical protein